MAYEPHNVCERNKNLSTKTKEEMVEHLTYLLQKKKKTGAAMRGLRSRSGAAAAWRVVPALTFLL